MAQSAPCRLFSAPHLAALLLLALCITGNGSTATAWADDPVRAPAESKDMKPLFNGRDLEGWDGDPRLWSVRDGVIRGETTSEKVASGNTFLICKAGDFRDFELRLTFRCNDANNSGIQYRSRRIDETKAKNRWVVHGYQHELRDENTLPNVAGFIYDEGGKRGRLCLAGERAVWEKGSKQVLGTLIEADAYRELFRLHEWNDVVIVARGNTIRHYLNDRLILEFEDRDPDLALREGVIALQLHAGKPMWTEFKDVRIRSLD
ncbi:MAG: DUF1080 domain-containing protein [Pirellula sp.]